MNNRRNLPIKSFCKTGSGGTPSRQKIDRYYENGVIPWVKSGELRESVILDTEEKITDLALKETSVKMVPKGALLVAMYGATIGRIATLGVDATTNQAVCHIIPDINIADPRYLFYALSNQVPTWINQGVGGAQPNISQQIIKETKVPLPPIAEQKRIAAILDKADAVRRKRREAIRLTEELLRSTFLEMFGDPVTNPNAWSVTELGQEVSEFRYGTSEKCEAYSILMNHPVLRIPNILDGEINLDDLKYTSVSKDEFDRIVLKPGDLLFVRSNGNPEYIGRCAVFSFEDSDTLYASYLIRARLKKSSIFLSEFVRDQILYPTYRHEVIKEAKTTAGNYNINIQGLSRLKLIAPPIDLQREYVLLYRKIRNSSIRLADHHQESENLFNALLQRAFTGNL
jgi:type I restriction enzyme, S subunit